MLAARVLARRNHSRNFPMFHPLVLTAKHGRIRRQRALCVMPMRPRSMQQSWRQCNAGNSSLCTVRTCAIPVGLQRACRGPAFRGLFLNDTVPKAGTKVFSRLKPENTALSEQGPGTCAVTACRRARVRVRFALTRPEHGALPLTRPQCRPLSLRAGGPLVRCTGIRCIRGRAD